MAYLADFYYHFNINHQGCDDMDYLEIMNLCGFDLDKAHEMAKERGTEDFSEVIKRELRTEQEGENVHTV